MFYMHLRFDHAWFSYVFIGPLIIAIGLAISLLWLFGHIGTTGADGGAGRPHDRLPLASGGRPRPGGAPGRLPPRHRARCGAAGAGDRRPRRARVAAFVGGTAILAGAAARAPRRVGRARRALGPHGPAPPPDPGRAAAVAPRAAAAWLLAPVARAPVVGRLGWGSPGRSRPSRWPPRSRSPGTSRPRSTPRSTWSGSTPSSTSRSSPPGSSSGGRSRVPPRSGRGRRRPRSSSISSSPRSR